MKKIFLFIAAAAMIAVSCSKNEDTKKNNTNKETDNKEVEEYKAPITIDGDFADWATLGTKAVSATTNADAPWDAVKEIRCYADEMYVYYYIEFDKEVVPELLKGTTEKNEKGEDQELPIRLNINTDGEFTSGYLNYSLDGYDFIIEGSLAAEGAWTSYDGTLHQRIDGKWKELLASGNGIASGAGKDNYYEIALVREIFNAAAASSTVPMPMGETFQTGIRFYDPAWGELSNMPNAAVTDDNTKGWGHLLSVTTAK